MKNNNAKYVVLGLLSHSPMTGYDIKESVATRMSYFWDPLNALKAMNKTVQDANGTIIQSITSFRSSHNQDVIREEASKITP